MVNDLPGPGGDHGYSQGSGEGAVRVTRVSDHTGSTQSPQETVHPVFSVTSFHGTN